MSEKIQEIKKFGNLVIVGSKDIKDYAYPLLQAGTSARYEPHADEGIVVMTTTKNLSKALYLINILRDWGIEEIDRQHKDKVQVTPADGAGYFLDDVWQIVLKKIPAIRH